ncbi:MAG: MFS transporter [Alloprevotella sp.]
MKHARLYLQICRKSPLSWIPTLYFAEGIPYVIVMTIALVMYKRLGLSNADVALYTSWLYLPWVIKPFWSPIVDMLRTKRWWILTMQLLIGASLSGVAFTVNAPHYVQWTLACFWLMAFSSATHDIAADGFYMLGLGEHDQSLYVGVRSTFYRIATIAGQGLLIMLAGALEVFTRKPAIAWSFTFWSAAAVFALLWLYHRYILPRPEADTPRNTSSERLLADFAATFLSFFRKPQIWAALAFMLLYRFPEALLTKICPLFFLDKSTEGGLGLTTVELGWVQGVAGVIGLTIGGILGGIAVARYGFRRLLWPMVASITLPDLLYILLAYYQPQGLAAPIVCVFIEQFGYGLGFTAYMLYLIYFSQGEQKTAHYAFCTGFMALSMMLPGMFAGELQELTGYLNFFILVTALTPLTFLAAWLVRVPADFGQKKTTEH